MKSRTLNRKLKLKIYKSLIRPVVTYGCEAWTLTTRDEQPLRIFERKILRKIFWPSTRQGWILENQNETRIERAHRKCRHRKIHKKQEDSLVRTCDEDG